MVWAIVQRQRQQQQQQQLQKQQQQRQQTKLACLVFRDRPTWIGYTDMHTYEPNIPMQRAEKHTIWWWHGIPPNRTSSTSSSLWRWWSSSPPPPYKPFVAYCCKRSPAKRNIAKKEHKTKTKTKQSNENVLQQVATCINMPPRTAGAWSDNKCWSSAANIATKQTTVCQPLAKADQSLKLKRAPVKRTENPTTLY